MVRMPLLIAAATVGILAWSASPAAAHFLWIDIAELGQGQPAAVVRFNEGPQPGSARLAAKIAPTKAWLRRGGDAAPQSLKLELTTDGETGQLSAPLDAAAPRAVDGTFDYGVFAHGEAPVLLHYYAQHIDAGNAGEAARLAPSPNLPLCIVPKDASGSLELEVRWKGKPAAGCQVVVLDDDNEDGAELTTDEHGRVRTTRPLGNRFVVRARRVEERKGEHAGQAYDAVHHYATLTCELAAAAPAAATKRGTAMEVLETAREARAVWADFPGFVAELELHQGEHHARGQIEVSPDCEVRLSGLEGIPLDRVQQILDSLVQHRNPGAALAGGVSFVEESSEHPLGTMIRFDDDEELHSAYRVKDDVVTEVNRQMGPLRFTISVLDVARNAEGKYLPTVFNVTFWDKESGELRFSESHLNLWVRVGPHDLPRRVVVLRAEDGKRDVVSMVLSGHRLLDAQ